MAVSSVGEIVWVLGIVAWYVIRYPFERRAKRVRVVSDRRSLSETVGLASALFGLAILPGFYVATGMPETADYPAGAWAVALGAIIFASGLWVFRCPTRCLAGIGRSRWRFSSSIDWSVPADTPSSATRCTPLFCLWRLARPFCCRTGSWDWQA